MTARRSIAAALVLALVASFFAAPAEAAKPTKPDKPGWSEVPKSTSVRGAGLRPRPRAADPAATGAVTKAPAVTWPKAGSADVELANTGAVRAGGLPVSVARRAGGAAERVRVEVLDRSTAERAGVDGLLFRVHRTDGARTAEPVTVDVDYSGFRQAFGGDYAARLALVRLPACAASTPQRPECLAGTPVPARNDVRAGRIRGDVTAAGAAGSAAAVYAVAATASGSAGSFKPTSLAPSAMWEVGLQSGDFSWAYPMDVPPVAGLEPSVALSYSSGAVDGRTFSTNNQASWIGDGFDFQPGFIERQYTSCGSDMAGGNNTAATGDLCYASANAVAALPGLAGELVWDASKRVWRAEEDEGWRVDQIFGASNGDNDGEHWRLTSPEGTQYFFGRSGATRSAYTVPVFGNQTGEPCHATSFAASWCQQAYRWMLDHVVDRHGDTIAYFYDTETNHYGRAGSAGNATPYVRSGQLARIDYGLREGQTEPAARVVFTAADRCIPGSSCQRSRPADWPDVPWDQQCDGGVCTGTSPVFFGTKRLAKVTTQVRNGGQLTDVDSWTFHHLFPANNDTTSPSLWLESIVHTGHAGGSLSAPEVNFDGELRDNRIEAADGEPWMRKWRLKRVNTETGGQIEVTYAPAGCSAGSLPTVDTNGLPCFPAQWTPQGATQSRLGWFHKQLVSEVREIDRVGGSPDEVTSYEYVDKAAWHYDDAELVPAELKTWGQWRGYNTVKVRTGAPGSVRTLVEHKFFRGMHGDKKLDGTTKQDEVGGREDLPVLRGFAHLEITYHGDGGPEIERALNEPVIIGPHAVRRRASGDLSAYTTDVKRSWTRTALAGGGYRETEEIHEFDPYGVPVRIDDRGDLSTTDDDRCTEVSYTPNLNAWLIGLPHRSETVAAACGAVVNRPADVISDVRAYYDGSDALGAAPTKGEVTRSEELSAWGDGGPVYTTLSRSVHDAHGREIEEYDALGRKTTTAYTPAVGSPVTEVRVTNALGHQTVTGLHPAKGSSLLVVDPAGRRTEMAYDPLGRLVKAWGPGRPRNGGPEVEFEYLVRNDGPSAVTTKTLLGNGGYRADHSLYDGFLRHRQSQGPAPGGGRIVADTIYDSHGRVAKTNAAYHNLDAPGTTLLAVNDAAVPAQTQFVYDGAGREVAEVFKVEGVEKWRTTTTYGGNWVREDPPAGDTPTTEVFDVEGRPTELRQHKNASEHDTTRYTYTKAGQVATVADAAGNVWRHQYDLRGREIRVDDPDMGTSTMTYDDEDQLLTTTDSRGRTTAFKYDALGRTTATFDGSTSGTKLTEKTYDSLGEGLPVASIRYANGHAYRSEVTGYDERGLVTGTAVTIPAVEGALAGRYESTPHFNDVGQVTAVTQPGVGGLPGETLRTGYDELGLPVSLIGLSTYVDSTNYTNLAELGEYILGGEDGKRLQQSFEYEAGTRRVTRSRVRQEFPETPTVERGFTYDPAGNLTKLVTSARDRATDTQCFAIDYLQRLTDAWTATDDCAGGPSLDKLGGPAPYWHSYTFDKVGNRLTETWHEAAGDTTRKYTYPEAGSRQPHALQSVTQTGPGGTRTDTYEYDTDGNTTARPGQTLTWNSEGQLDSIKVGADTTSFLYDPDGERLIRREPGATTLYLGDTELRLDAKTGSVSGTRYYSFHDATIAVRTPAGLNWLFGDHHGTGETTVSAESQLVTHRLHLPYGAPRGGTPTNWPGEKGFVGGTRDASTGLTHLGAREYDDLTGRFLSVDPVIDVADPQQMQGYAYGNNNPVSFSDPDGLKAKPKNKKTKTTKATKKTTKSKPKKSSAKPTPCYSERQCETEARIQAKKKKPKAKAPKVYPCKSERNCETEARIRENKKNQQRDRALAKCGGTIRACEHRDEQVRKDRESKEGLAKCGGTKRACEEKERRRPRKPSLGDRVKKGLDAVRPLAEVGHELGAGVNALASTVAGACAIARQAGCAAVAAKVGKAGAGLQVVSGAAMAADECLNAKGKCALQSAAFGNDIASVFLPSASVSVFAKRFAPAPVVGNTKRDLYPWETWYPKRKKAPRR
ncbi:RHS repeat-associated core domain-containing protein [Actinomycetes bacterium KLBMP 9797]